jgi:hypothetical protein
MKNVITAIALAASTVGAFAAEFTNFDIPASVLTRAEVRAAIVGGPRDIAVQYGEATQFALPAAGATGSFAIQAVASDSAPVVIGEATEFPIASRPVARTAQQPSATLSARH